MSQARIQARHSVMIRADRDRFRIVPAPGEPLDVILAELRHKVEESRNFFRNSRMVLDLSQRSFDPREIRAIQFVLRETGGLNLDEVDLGENVQPFFRWASAELGVEFVSSDERVLEGVEKHREPADEITTPLLVRQTCRSGMRIESPSHCIILGDVNPGAEIVAVGDIVVFGHLRGIAHAGVDGDRDAQIWAISIEPHQLRIADLVALPPKGRRPRARRYEVARVRGQRIEVVSV